MNLAKLALLSTRSIFRNKMRSLLTSLGIIIGVCSVIVMVALGQGSQQQVARQIASMGTNLIMVMPPRSPGVGNRLTLADVRKIRSEASYLSAISGGLRLSLKAVGGSGYWSTSVEGVEPDFLKIRQWSVESGEFFTDRDLATRNKVAVIGSTVAAELFAGRDPVGQQLRLGTTPFTIIGVLASKGASGMGDDQDDTVLVPLDTAIARLEKDPYIGNIQMSAARADFMDQAQAEVTTILREAHRIKAGQTDDFDVMNQADIIKTASQTSKTLTTLLAAIAGVSLIVGGIGIMNIMLVSVTERTREIGIRMSVGARRRDILLQFLAESVMLSMLGGLVGIAAALGLIFVLSNFASIPAVVSPLVVALSAGFAAAVGVFFGYYPAREAARMYPIDALRYE